ncbi:hypothetical protein BRO54_0323 [Geobacillus proteiniphilus]|uniref:Uncharacterized protein n=1 Tax=Geobacillus proteiniphilus TaxID=860353 RepID=A0A1Q5T989_9BACL|nr:hypothetical protein BRO54_0323 [Geobacillus proteiniphilus]
MSPVALCQIIFVRQSGQCIMKIESWKEGDFVNVPEKQAVSREEFYRKSRLSSHGFNRGMKDGVAR